MSTQTDNNSAARDAGQDSTGPTPTEYGDLWQPLRERLSMNECQYLNTYTCTGDIAALNALVLGIISQRDELLEACKALMKAARTAIAKAEGRE